tara:strand:- start:12404 stop:14476 length:2073 start_codon:yes stop_codon:yes gene_type:complete
MATSSIFKYANDISMNRSANSARSVTTGGYARTHRLGPSVMSFEADLPLLTEEQYREVENELFSIDDGIKFLNVNISSNNGNNIMQSTSVPLKPGETNIKLIAYSYSTTREITLANLAPNTTDIFKVGDFLQFENFHKLYQIAKPLGSTNSTFTSSDTGTCKVRLSTPLLSSVGLPATSVGSTDRYYIVTGEADEYEIISYDLFGGPVQNSTNASEGKIIFKDATSGNQLTYDDGTNIEIIIPNNTTSNYQIRSIFSQSLNSVYNSSNLTTAQNAQNNKISQVLHSVSYSGGIGTGVLTFTSTTANIRAELTDVSMVGQTLDGLTVINAFTTPYQDGTMTIKLSNGNTALDSKGNALVINIPSTNRTAKEVITYLETLIESADSTSVLRTDGVITNLGAKAFPQDYGETLADHVGYFEITWGLDYEGCSLEYTTPTGTDAVNYNPINLTGDEVATVITNGITIENASGTYTAGGYINTLVDAPQLANTRRIQSVNTSGSTTTINFVTAEEGTIATVGTFSAADPLRTETTHTNVPGISDNPLSTVGTFDIDVDSNGAITSVVVNTPSTNVRVGDEITIGDDDMDNIEADDFTFEIATINNNGITTFDSTNYTDKEIYSHANDASSTSNKVFFEITNVSPSSVSYSNVNILMGADVNMKLMLTNKPSVTIVPKDETENLYKYDTFKFAEVL